MFNLFDILQGQGGRDMQGIGQQFGLTPDQSRRAMEALLPALTIGLQRNAADPAGFGRLFGLAGSVPGARSPSQPDLLLGQLFGSPALSQAVLQQAAAASGIGTQALRQMLPVMAGMVVAGIVHMMLNQPASAPPARSEPEPAPVFPAVGFWQDWLDGFLASPGSADRAGRPQSGAAPLRTDNAARRDPPPAPAPEARSGEADPGQRRDVPLEVLQQMFQTGAQVQEQNVKAMQELFDTFWKPSPGAEAAALPADDVQAPPEVDPQTELQPLQAAKPRARPRSDRGPR